MFPAGYVKHNLKKKLFSISGFPLIAEQHRPTFD